MELRDRAFEWMLSVVLAQFDLRMSDPRCLTLEQACTDLVAIFQENDRQRNRESGLVS